LADLTPPPAALRAWALEELDILDRTDAEVSAEARQRLSGGRQERQALVRLWDACRSLQPDPPPRPASSPPGAEEALELWHLHTLRREAAARLSDLLRRLGAELTLRGLLQALTGRDVLDDMRSYFIRHLASHLDQGLARWHSPARTLGFYAAWRASACGDPHFDLKGLGTWQQALERLPDTPEQAILQSLMALGLEPERWESYLENLAKELPGWSGMVLWRARHPERAGPEAPVAMVDCLAVRLVLEHVHAQTLCGRHFKTEASLPGLRGYLRRHPAELLVRLALFGDELPEWLADQGHRLVRAATGRTEEETDADWLPVARLLDEWRHGRRDLLQPGDAPPDARAWQLFRLCQHLGLDAEALGAAGADGARALLDCLGDLTAERQGWVWLQAYERHYRQQVFAALQANHGRGPWQSRQSAATPPRAQLVFCMDDREEGLRRHLEEDNPWLETLGAAAHFELFVRYLGLGDPRPTDLYPVTARPSHTVCEEAAPGAGNRGQAFVNARVRRLAWQARVLHGSRRDPLRGLLISLAGAPAALALLAGKMLAPAAVGRWLGTLGRAFDGPVATRLSFTAPQGGQTTREGLPAGFTDTEQAARVESLLRGMGLTGGFAPLVVIVGHGSNSQNNPHLAAYDCGACSGRHSGPNARLFAAMANREQVRALLHGRGIHIPAATWFVGCEHNTCDDSLTWYDGEALPAGHLQPLHELDAALRRAGELHAQERCRRFSSAALDLNPARARGHALRRRFDYSEPRPELGHANNACAFIGRRAATRGVFFDRRMFLISYDCTRDPEGTVLEGLLLANGPVGAGINLEYYFSTVDNQRYGCGSKVAHNVTGLFGVLEGTTSDLRTGLPRQMIEIHEPMRLLIVVEHGLDVLTAVYERQPPLQELIGNGWVHLGAKDPDSPAIHRLVPGSGWVRWQDPGAVLPRVRCSAEWVRGKRTALPPALIDAAVGGPA
jgi:hypothetical protein